MTRSDANVTVSLSKKLSLVTHHHLLTRVPVKLDLENWNYGSTSTPFTLEELKFDKIVLSWIFSTLSDPLQARLVVERPKTTKEAWDLISDIVKDNKRLRTNALKAELRSIKLGDLSMLGSVPEPFSISVLRRLESIFPLVYAAVQKLKKVFGKSFSSTWNPETQWAPEERKTANLDQRLKSLIMSVLPDDQMNSVINCLTAKSTWDDLILYHDGDLDILVPATTNVHTAFFFILLSRDLQDKSDDEEDTRSSQDSSASAPNSSSSKRKGIIAETYDWDEDEMSSDDNEVTKVKDLMALCFVSGGGGGGSVDVVSVVSVTLREHHADASRGYDDLVP
ncbi:hypothetical protein Tco_0071146 [Tanacetum coccineum]